MKITVMSQGLTGAIPFYRLYQPLKYCEKKGLLQVVFHDVNTEEKDIITELEDTDIIVWQCATSINVLKWIHAIKIENKEEGRNRKSVMEFDDDLMHISPYNQKYQVFGTNEMYITIGEEEKAKYDKLNQLYKDGKKEIWKLPDGRYEYKLWEDKQDGFFLDQNRERVAAALRSVAYCDLFQCTTKELAKVWANESGRTGPIAILPNLIDFSRWLPQKTNDTGKIRIMWQGGSSHYADWQACLEACIKLQEKYGDRLTFVVAGQVWKGLHGKLKNVELHEWHSDILTYPLMMRELKADIGIIPLTNEKFNKGKSPLKWLEYSALKIPTVASNVTPYKEVIEYGKTGYLVENDTKSWFDHIESLINNPDKGKEMAERAHQRVRTKWSLERSVEWYEAYKTLGAYSKKKTGLVDINGNKM
jgi:glycosyltransferase involved in cell wall biosynthesis